MSEQEQRRERRGFIVLLTMVVGLMVVWNHLYVQPREDFLHSVMECAGEDGSQAAYQACVKQVRSSRE